ncbi:conserved membrane hypothetical protein [Gammaproteobacteria bacterium]
MKSFFSRLLLSVCLLSAFIVPSASFAADLSITATSVVPSSAAVIRNATAGAAITAGKLVYKSATDGKLYLADGDSGTSAVRDCVGIAVVSAAIGAPCYFVIEDPALVIGATVANGTIYGLSATAGGIAPSADFTTGWYVTVVAVGTSTTTVSFRAKGIRTGTAL